MITTRQIDRLPQFRDALIQQRARDYLIDGVSYARVTSALAVINKPGLLGWARNVTLDKVRDVLRLGAKEIPSPRFSDATIDRFIEAVKKLPDPAAVTAELGTQAHSLIQRLLEGAASAAEEIPDELRPAIYGASDFLRDEMIQPMQTEFTVWDTEQKIAGTIDCVGMAYDKERPLPGEIAIVDWKRSKGIFPEHFLQVSMYARLFELTTGQAVKEAWGSPAPAGISAYRGPYL